MEHSAIPLLGIYPKKTTIQKDTCTPVFIAAIFTVAKTWKQPTCPSIYEWINKLWYIHTLEYYSAIKRNTFESVLMRWMNIESIIQSEVSQKEKYKYAQEYKISLVFVYIKKETSGYLSKIHQYYLSKIYQ